MKASHLSGRHSSEGRVPLAWVLTLATLIVVGLVVRGARLADTKASSNDSARSKLGPIQLQLRELHSLSAIYNGVETPQQLESATALRSILARYGQMARPGPDLTPEMFENRLRDLEAYITNYPTGPYTPGVEQSLADYYRNSGHYTKALEHWSNAWLATSEYKDGEGKRIADETLPRWASLLASLGRLEDLEKLIPTQAGRQFDDPRLAQIWNRTKEAVVHMARTPAIAYRCGPLAMNNVLARSKGRNLSVLLESGSPVTGFSLAELAELSNRNSLGLSAAYREPGATVVVPAVVHWRQNHYAAIVDAKDDQLLVIDPTFGQPIWMDLETVEAEASGYFMIQESTLPKGWRWVDFREGAGIHGKGYPQIMDDSGGSGPCSEECCEAGPGGSGTGSGTNECGMASWKVIEPNINLQISDIPMMWKSAFGPDFVLSLNWRQRDSDTLGYQQQLGATANFGPAWTSDLLSNIEGYNGYNKGLGPALFRLLHGNGFLTELNFSDGQTTSVSEYRTGITAVRTVSGSTVTTLTLFFRNGSVEQYNRIGTTVYYQLTSRKDATGQAVSFFYDDPESRGYSSRLHHVTTADSAVFTFAYGDTFGTGDLYRITGVTGPDTRNVSFTYSTVASTRVLTKIKDVVNMESSFAYNSITWWITQLTTPYGTTQFAHFDAGFCGIHELECAGVDRAIVITEPDGSHQAYAFYDNNSGTEMGFRIPDNFNASTQIPTFNGASDPPIQTLDTIRNQRNSHYWNRQQAVGFSTYDPTAFNSPSVGLYAAQFQRSRTTHWLIAGPTHLMRTRSWELAPCADGQNEPQPIFYDYPSKMDGNPYEGSSGSPALRIQRRLSGTGHFATWYEYIQRNAQGQRTSVVERWSSNSVVLYRTNTFQYATSSDKSVDGLLRLQQLGPSGERIFGYALHPTYQDQVQRATNAAGDVTIYDYDVNRRLTTSLTQAGLLSTYSYDPTTKRVALIVDSISGIPLRTNSYTYFNGYLRTHTDPRGLVRTYDYDFLGRLTKVSYPDLTYEEHYYVLPAATGFNTGGAPLPVLDRIGSRDRLGQYSYFLPNRLRQLATLYEPPKVVGGVGTRTEISYCGCGSPTSVVRAYGTAQAESTSIDYDFWGKPTLVTLPDGAKYTNRYDALGLLIRREDFYQKMTNIYDNLNRLVSRQNGAGLVEGIGYHQRDWVLTSTNANGVVVKATYDDAGRIKTRTQPDTGLEQWNYTVGFPEATSYVNQVNHTTSWKYDASLRRTNETVVGVYTNSFKYTPADDLIELYDGKQTGTATKTSWVFDTYGREIQKRYADNVLNITNGYDNLHRLTKRWTLQKGLTTFSYDSVGNLTNVAYPVSPALNFEYNNLNRRVKDYKTGLLTSEYTYKPSGQLESEKTTEWASSQVTLGYNSRLRTSLALQQPLIGDWTQSYVNDASRRLQSLTSAAGAFTYSYVSAAGTTASRLVQSITVPTTVPSSQISNVYDTTGHLKSTTLKTGTTIHNNHSYNVNMANERSQQTFPDGSVSDYTYDNAEQLYTALNSNPANPQLKYGYDAGMNLVQRTNGASVTTYAVNSLNQLTGDGTYTYAPDANGNRISRSLGATSLQYTYDDENQLVAVETDTTATPAANRFKTEFVYDARGRMRIRREYNWPTVAWSLTTEVRYIYDGRRVIQERNSSGTPLVTYTRGLDLSHTIERAGGIGGLLARTAHSGANGVTLAHAFYHADGNGNITYLINPDKTLGASYVYDPFGRTINSSITALTSENSIRFSSKEMMASSGLYYYGFRFYDPTTQRWMNRDRIQEVGGLNLYGFVRNDSVDNIDIYGLCNYSKTGVGLVNIGRGIAKTVIGVNEAMFAAGVGSAGTLTGPAAPIMEALAGIAGLDGAKNIIGGGMIARRGINQVAEGIPDNDKWHWRNLLGLLPFGGLYDDPGEDPRDAWKNFMDMPFMHKLGELCTF